MNVLTNAQVSRANYLNNLRANTTRDGYTFTPVTPVTRLVRASDDLLGMTVTVVVLAIGYIAYAVL
jgi:hypothetical protein